MSRYLSIPAMVLLCAPCAYSQTAPVKGEEPCLLSTDKEAWMALELTSAQVEQVQSLQTACVTDCTSLPEGGKRDPSTSGALVEQYTERVRKVLTDEQYTKWLVWCEERTVRGAK